MFNYFNRKTLTYFNCVIYLKRGIANERKKALIETFQNDFPELSAFSVTDIYAKRQSIFISQKNVKLKIVKKLNSWVSRQSQIVAYYKLN